MSDKIIVIGAGIIGVSCALQLQRQGFHVQLFEKTGIAAQASAGNAGAFAFTDIEPLATPGIMKKVPKWLLDPLGPLSIPPAYALKILPWMLHFWRASWTDRYQQAVMTQSQLMNLSRQALERQIKTINGEALIRREGQLQLYANEKELKADLPAWTLRQKHGIPFEFLTSREAIAAIQPGIHPRFTHAVFTPTWLNTVDPKKWVQTLAAEFQASGGLITQCNVQSMKAEGKGIQLHTKADDKITPYFTDQVVVAAGAWSHHLAQTVGDSILLETERGYNTTLPAGAFDLRTQLSFSNHGFVVTRIGEGVRVGGAVELGGLTRQANYRRADILLSKAAQFLPTLKTTQGKQWMGFRPSLPDSLPIISRSPHVPNIIYAFGHGHLGLTQSAATAELVADLASRREPVMDISRLAADRF